MAAPMVNAILICKLGKVSQRLMPAKKSMLSTVHSTIDVKMPNINAFTTADFAEGHHMPLMGI